MWHTTEIISVRCRQPAVYEYLAEMTNIVDWDPSVASASRLTAGTLRVGSRFQLAVAVGPRQVPMTYEIAEMTAPARLVLRGRGEGFTAIDDITLTTDRGMTHIDYRVTLSFDKAPAAPASGLVRQLFLRNVRRAAGRLAAVFNGTVPLPRVTLPVFAADHAILPGLMGFTRLGYRLAHRHRPFADALLQNRSIVVTGATGGIGLATARSLHRLGARLILVGRNREKTEATRKALLKDGGPGDIHCEIADMSLMSDVARLAQRLLDGNRPIHVLVNNAGALFNAREETAEGVEKSFAVNLLGPYLLSRRLHPRLKESRPARIINVASGGMYTQKLAVDDLESRRGHYAGPDAYARAKRGLVVAGRLLANTFRADGVSVHAMHPGWVDTPGLHAALPGFYNRVRPWLRSPAEGADTIVWLCGAAEGELTSGLFWRDRRPRVEYVFPGTREAPSDAGRLTAALDRRIDTVL